MLFCADAAHAERYLAWDADIKVNPDTRLDVTEKIVIDFEDAERHGIFRHIPSVYRRHNNAYTTELNIQSVTNEFGVPQETSIGTFNGDVNIKIGNRKSKVSGIHTYVINYHAGRVVNWFNNRPEIYWNVTGNENPFPIDKATATLHLPPGVNPKDVSVHSFQGPLGSKTHAVSKTKGNDLYYEAKNLKPSEGLTIVALLPAGVLTPPGIVQEVMWWIVDWWPAIVLPSALFAWICSIWMARGRDPGNVQIAGVEWNPPKDLTPAEVGTLVDENCDTQDIVSTLVDLAVRGYLRIEELSPAGFIFSAKDYMFSSLKARSEWVQLKDHEQRFLEALFTSGDKVTLKDLKFKFYRHLPKIRDSIYGELTDQQYFVSNPDGVRRFYWRFAILLTLVGALIFMKGYSQSWGIGITVCGIILFAFGNAMPARTKKGVDSCREAVGFRRFVQKAEKERIKVLAKEDPTIFGRLLPFAMVLGAADDWAYNFRDLLTEEQDWYVPLNRSSQFSSRALVNDLGDGMRSWGSAFESTPSSSGSGAGGGFSGSSGGFSGGGFGGGGSGSW